MATATLTWGQLLRRTYADSREDDIFGLAAQLSYYFFLALFPAILFGLGVASFFQLETVADDVARVLSPIMSPQIVDLIAEQMRRIANRDSTGILTFGAVVALWSSSGALTSIIAAVNRAYDIEEQRPWWRVRLLAIALTLAVAVLILTAFTVVVAGPTVAGWLRGAFGGGTLFDTIAAIVRWPIAFVLVSTALGLIYYFGPDADQDWQWTTPGALIATALWLLASVAFKIYVTNFTDYEAAYGTIGAAMVLLLWLYLSSLAVLIGAELNAELEQAADHAKTVPRNAYGRRVLGARARREFERSRLPEAP
ncbi:MAG TPA: YihY/virulence factor BrkB family protein [Vicinamibacterales bacterium]|nr:YihY/virulence factor BrkB family protein [Vicinamibacterales bacterium]